MHPDRPERAHPSCVRPRQPRRRRPAADLLFEPLEPSGRDADHVHAPRSWQAKTGVGAARDYFFDVWWRQAFTALVYGAFPIDRTRGAKGAVDKARELLSEGWSIVVFPEGTRSADGHLQRFRHGAARLALETGAGLAPIAIVGAFQAMPKGRFWPRSGRPPVTVRYGEPFWPREGETHQDLSRRMTQAVTQLFHEERTTWWEALHRANQGETPSLVGPQGPIGSGGGRARAPSGARAPRRSGSSADAEDRRRGTALDPHRRGDPAVRSRGLRRARASTTSPAPSASGSRPSCTTSRTRTRCSRRVSRRRGSGWRR